MEHHHAHNNNVYGRIRFGIAIILNVIITIAEYIGGIISGSLALISDAGHNLSDVLSLLLGYAGERVSQIKPGANYSFGFKRFEVVIALVNAASLIVIGVFIVIEAVARYYNPQPVNLKIMMIIAAVGLAGNFFSMLILKTDKDKNLNMRSAFLHLLYDAISSVAVIAAAIVMEFTGLTVFDLLISIVIVIMMVLSSMHIIFEAMRIFLQGVPKNLDPDDVYMNLRSIDNVGGVHGLHIWSISSSEVFLSCHISLNRDRNEINTDSVIQGANRMLEEKYGITHTTIQIENKQICSDDNDACCR